MKNLYVYYHESIYGTAFFDGDECINYVNENDGTWRDEYFNGMLEHFGIQVSRIRKINAKQKRSLRELRGISEDE